ncbi:3-oxoacyl-ACP reductase FabG [Robertmurraya sp. DFI.2.37]|uniref:SDR family NAD(P)-dependent oxidoreductase n=1 Tax=Robertmurraya sp. DFI.2.37 TaxID=3031819 RepID=UPI001245AFE5|nr:3-oxoacyl-ACP reductase family protein [Robertmurraya sp. DFI.2.37]MDF1511299.1 3-oxoacyl-ACP reductase FabG [Robertmurraya sp. DFI.2.37]
MYSFQDKVIFVTGSSSGIGKSIILGFSELGASVIVHGNKNLVAAEQLVAQIVAKGKKALLVSGDVTNAKQVQKMVSKIEQEFGRVDVLVNNAGSMVKRSRIEDMEEELWEQIFNVNLKSAFLVTKSVVPLMKKQGKGRIINVTSIAARNGGGNGAVAYASAKGGLSTFTRGLAKELIADHIYVNGIAPGFIETPFHSNTSEEMRVNMTKQIPLGREGMPEEMVGAVLFLASDAASYITGEIIEVNGGLLMD